VLSYQYWAPQQFPLGFEKPAITTKFSLQNAPSESLKGTIASLSGTVSWLSRTGVKPVQLKGQQVIQQGEEISTGSNGKVVLNIQNDSWLALAPNTHVSIIQLLPQNFVFEQDHGTAGYQNTIQVPVSIKSLDLVTLVNKGIVSLSVDPQKQIVTLSVKKGTAKEGYEDLQNTTNVVTVTAGQTFVFDETNKIGTIQ
jgi:hypothetical protein